jgi:hypothetical protein
VDEDVLARLQLAEHNQRLLHCMYASTVVRGLEDRRHAPVSQSSGMLAGSTNERDAGFGMRCVAGDTMYSSYAPYEQDSLSATSRRDKRRHAHHTRARRPRRPASSAQSPRAEPLPPRHRGPPPAPARRARRSPQTGRRGSRSRPSALRAVSASALPHPARRARTGIHAVALHDVHPVQAERADLDEHLARARGGARRVAEEERAGVARTVAHEHGAHRLGVIVGGCEVCGRRVKTES